MTSPRAHLQIRQHKDPCSETQVAPVEGPVEGPVEALAEPLEGSAVVLPANHHVDVEMLDMSPSWLAPNVGTQDRRYDK